MYNQIISTISPTNSDIFFYVCNMRLETHVFNVDGKDSDQTAFSYTTIFKLVNEFIKKKHAWICKEFKG